MGKNKKPKKVYKPKLKHVPSIINSLLTFKPFEEALQKIIDTGYAEIDDFDNLIYHDLHGKRHSFESDLKIYGTFVLKRASEINLVIDFSPFETLIETLKNKEPIDEENIEEVIKLSNFSRVLVAKTPPADVLRIMATIRAEINAQKCKVVSNSDTVNN